MLMDSSGNWIVALLRVRITFLTIVFGKVSRVFFSCFSFVIIISSCSPCVMVRKSPFRRSINS